MSFDLVDYLTQQVTSQYPNLLAAENKTTRIQTLQHIVASELQLLYQHPSTERLNKIKKEDSTWLAQQTHAFINEHEQFKRFLAPLETKSQQVVEKTSILVIHELQQLEQISSLGASGIDELLNAQYEYLPQHTQAWFLKALGREDLISSQDTPSESADFNEVMQEFNQMLQQQISHQHAAPVVVAEPVIVAAPSCYRLLSPVVALLILLGSFHFLCQAFPM